MFALMLLKGNALTLLRNTSFCIYTKSISCHRTFKVCWIHIFFQKKKDLVKFQTSLCSFHVVSKLLEKLVSLLSSLMIMCFCTRIVRRIIKQEATGNVNSHNSQACTLKYASLFYWENLLAIVDFRKWSNLKWILHFISFQKAFVSFRLLQILIPEEMFR